MILLCFVLSVLLWQEDFAEDISTMSQLYDYTVNITHENGRVYLKADPQSEGFASAWFYVDDNIVLSSENIVALDVKINDNKVRLRYFYRKRSRSVYFAGEEIIGPDSKWRRVTIPLEQAKPFYSSNFPYALTPNKSPALFLFIENALPGHFDVEVDRISILGAKTKKEER